MAGTRASIGQHDLATLGVDEGSRVPLPDRGDRRHAHWERQVHASVGVLVGKGLMTVDEMRRCIEGLQPVVYATAGYYEKWASALCTLLLERQVFTNAELEKHLGPTEEAAPSEPFAVGATVRVRSAAHSTRWRRPHLRTPGFVHGVCGVVERFVGHFPNPEQLAFGGRSSTATKLPLYIVRFDWDSVCDFAAANGQKSDAADAVTCEIYHSWLEVASEAALVAQREAHRKRSLDLPASGQPDCKKPRTQGHAAHDHGEGASHVHEERLTVEQKAVDAEIPRPAIAKALIEVLQAKGVVAAEELRAAIEKVDAIEINRGAVGRRVVARAWTDPAYKKRLLEDGNAACKELGIQASNSTAPTHLMVMEQTNEDHHLIVCTLCSCYPLALLGLSPDWYKSREYRARAVREPRAVLREFGTEVPPGQRVVVHDSTADCRYLILPQRPAGTEGWTEDQLKEIITRDSMIGVTGLPSVSVTPSSA